MTTCLRLFCVLACLFLSGLAGAETVVVIGAKSGVDRLSRDEVINIFLGRHRKLPNGLAAQPFDLPVADRLRGEFYRRLVDKSLAEIDAYWARLVFTGKAAQPQTAVSVPDILRAVAGTPGAIAYVDRSQVDDRVQVVFSLGN